MNRYGLIGHKLPHSYSPQIHEYLFKKNNIDATYSLIEVEENELSECISKLRNDEYQGFNVTIPYKEKVICLCDELTEAAKEIGAVNTIYLSNGKIIGDNTDHSGFALQLDIQNVDVENKNVYILGNGGAAKAVTYAFSKMNANVINVSRSGVGITYDELKEIKHYDILVNTTPLGMFPNTDASILEEEYVKRADVCIDLIYNPRLTKFLSFAKKGYHSLLMLILQAIRAEEIWQGFKLEYDIKELEELL